MTGCQFECNNTTKVFWRHRCGEFSRLATSQLFTIFFWGKKSRISNSPPRWQQYINNNNVSNSVMHAKVNHFKNVCKCGKALGKKIARVLKLYDFLIMVNIIVIRFWLLAPDPAADADGCNWQASFDCTAGQS